MSQPTLARPQPEPRQGYRAFQDIRTRCHQPTALPIDLKTVLEALK